MARPYLRLRAYAVAVLCVAMLGPGARAAETILVGSVGSASANLWPVMAGEKKGFFAAEGIKIDMVYVQANAGVIQQLTVDAVNVSVGSGLVDPIRAVDKGAPLAIARIEMQRPPYTLLAKPAIRSIKDLKGRIVSVGGAKDITRIFFERMLARAGVEAGLPAELATRLARETVAGSGELLRRSDASSATLRQNVTSPGGTTAAALEVLMGSDGMQSLLTRAVAAATKRSKELAR